MPEALDNGSQPYSCLLGDCEMAGKGLPSIIKACLYGRRHGQLLSLAYQQGALCDVALTSHFEKPKGFSVWLATIV